MSVLIAILVFAAGVIATVLVNLLSQDAAAWAPRLAEKLARRAAGKLPDEHRARWLAEWTADLATYSDRPLTALALAIGIMRNARQLALELQPAVAPAEAADAAPPRHQRRPARRTPAAAAAAAATTAHGGARLKALLARVPVLGSAYHRGAHKLLASVIAAPQDMLVALRDMRAAPRELLAAMRGVATLPRELLAAMRDVATLPRDMLTGLRQIFQQLPMQLGTALADLVATLATIFQPPSPKMTVLGLLPALVVAGIVILLATGGPAVALGAVVAVAGLATSWRGR